MTNRFASSLPEGEGIVLRGGIYPDRSQTRPLAKEIYDLLLNACVDARSREAMAGLEGKIVDALEELRPQLLRDIRDEMYWPPLREGSAISAMDVLRRKSRYDWLVGREKDWLCYICKEIDRETERQPKPATPKAPVAAEISAVAPPLLPPALPQTGTRQQAVCLGHRTSGRVRRRTLGAFRAALLEDMECNGDGNVRLGELADNATVTRLLEKPGMKHALGMTGKNEAAARRQARTALKIMASERYLGKVASQSPNARVTGSMTVSQLLHNFDAR